jgi:hypothetical protein
MQCRSTARYDGAIDMIRMTRSERHDAAHRCEIFEHSDFLIVTDATRCRHAMNTIDIFTAVIDTSLPHRNRLALSSTVI